MTLVGNNRRRANDGRPNDVRSESQHPFFGLDAKNRNIITGIMW